MIAPSTLPHGTAGTAYSATLTASGGLGAPYVFSLAVGSHLPPGLSLSSAGVISGTPSEDGRYTFTVSVDDPVTQRYTLVIDPARGVAASGTAPISNTGTPVASMTTVGAAAVLAGLVLLYGAGIIGRRPGRHRG